MEIILKQDVEKLGHKNDIVSVRPGYANNCLIPQGYATLATPSAKKVLAENLRQTAHKETKLRDDASAIAAKLEAIELSISARASEGGKIFGSVSSAQIAEALEAKGFAIDKKSISCDTIKEVGSFEASVKLYKDIKATVKFTIVAQIAE